MKAKKAIGFAAVTLFTMFFALPIARAVTHTSVFTTIDLSLKQPLDVRSETRLVSIAADGLVTIRVGRDSTFTARSGESFRDAHGRTPGTQWILISINPAQDAVVIRYETRAYLIPSTPTHKERK